MTKLFTSCWMLVFSISTFSQVKFDKRIEFEIGDGFDNERIDTFGEGGMLVRSTSEDDKDGKTEWKYELYNTDLELTTTESVNLDKKFVADETITSDTHIHTLYKNNKGEFKIVSLKVPEMEVITAAGNLPPKAYILGMEVLGDYAYFKASVKKEDFLLSINWKTGKQQLIPVRIPGYTGKQIALLNFQLLEESNEIFLFVKATIKKVSEMYVVVLDDTGDEKDRFHLTEDVDRNFVSVTASNVGKGRYIYTGTYSDKSAGSSIGLFFCQAAAGKIDFVEFYNFLDLENFLTYLPEKKQEKIEKKQAKKKANDKELTINYYIAQHDIIPLENGYMFLGEAYYPTYRTETYTSYVNGKPVTSTRTVFDGYQYTHAVLVRFDSKGKIVWDQTFAMWPSYKPYSVKRFISVPEITSKSVDMLFSSYGKIHSKSFSFDGTVLKEASMDIIDTGKEGDGKVKSGVSNVSHWYGKYFIAHGYQVIKNKENDDVKRKRKVIYVNKLSL